ncbi:hypothetical protein GA0074696_1597 [Micromonospora purpureochromogenes]|uniref:Uncharacterized protein n=2 Tax=Micromonospora purpureochromogenes TaxID=47872 RepID=A0A1C4W3Z1_9ACTN|nr:hypothetical protein GA0074696_1597 [Micromonospora purpureochromogenes]
MRGFARVSGMSDEYVDPSGNTEQFRAFAHSEPAAPVEVASRLPLIAGAAAVAVLLVAVAAWLALG